MNRVAAAAHDVLADIKLFSEHVIDLPLYEYQLEPLRAILRSMTDGRGDEFLLVMSRQSGKNEAVGQLLVYLLNIYQREGGNIVFGALGDGIGRGVRRLEDRLQNTWNVGKWKRRAQPTRRSYGSCNVVFLSTHINAAARGETAHHLMIIDELQDQDASHLEAVFTPMRASTNCTAVYLGTVRTSYDALWTKKRQLEALTERDHRPRVFIVGPTRITAENPNYARFLKTQEEKYGRHHPIIASEYHLEPLDRDSSLFPARRLLLMTGSQRQQKTPTPGETYIAVLDVAGADEGATDPIAALKHPARDYTAVTIHRIQHDAQRERPSYFAVDIMIDQGTKHFQEHPGRPALSEQILAYLRHWNIAHLVADASGVGEGLTDWLTDQLGPNRVTAVKFTRNLKAEIGTRFLSIIETGRYKYFAQEIEFDDAWWFFQQAENCTYELPPTGIFEKDLRWYVPANFKVSTPQGMEFLHDDRLLSAALIAKVDELIVDGAISIGSAHSIILDGEDPLSNLKF